MARVDHNISDRNRLFGRFTQSWLHYAHGNAFNNDARGLDRYRKQWGAALDDVYTFSPTLIVNLKYGFTRYLQSDAPSSAGFDLSSLGMPAGLVNQIDPQGAAFPYVNISGLTRLGETNDRNQFITNYQTWSAGFTKIAGNHSIRWGGEYRLMRENTANLGNSTPELDFAANWTKGPLDNSPASPIGQGLASFLLGIPTGGSIDLNATYAEQSAFTGLYVQDDWKLTRKLTMNIGLRWEYETAPTERFDRTVRGFDPTAASIRQSRARSRRWRWRTTRRPRT
ncbi:MAG: hypothetical protein M1541_13255 [Acidobacteria bacterium]|nr:hypothetical protein [Acidobacteriota bacterium]